jgi:hypothetical protein
MSAFRRKMKIFIYGNILKVGLKLNNQIFSGWEGQNLEWLNWSIKINQAYFNR